MKDQQEQGNFGSQLRSYMMNDQEDMVEIYDHTISDNSKVAPESDMEYGR
jgi:hypothetical protein